MIKWSNEIDAIKELSKTKTLQEIGESYGVSRQRMYQVYSKFGIETGLRKRRGFLHGKPPKYHWLNKMLVLKGVPKELRIDLLNTMEIPDNCPILGAPLNYLGTGRSGFTRGDNSPSIDQIKPGEGYTKDNMAIISWRANRIKNDGTYEELYKIAKWLESKVKNK